MNLHVLGELFLTSNEGMSKCIGVSKQMVDLAKQAVQSLVRHGSPSAKCHNVKLLNISPANVSQSKSILTLFHHLGTVH